MLSKNWNTTDNVYYRQAIGLRLHYEFVSKYRRVTVVETGGAFEIQVTYKGLGLSSWSKRYGVKEDAIAWAMAQSENNQIIVGCLTVKDFNGKQII